MASFTYYSKQFKDILPSTYKAIFLFCTLLAFLLLRGTWPYLVGHNAYDTSDNNSNRLDCPSTLYLSKSVGYAHRGLEQISPYTSDKEWKLTTWNQTILVLTPVSNARRYLSHYFKLLCSLNYPHHLISLGIGEDSSSDGTYEYAKKLSSQIRTYFRGVNVFRFKTAFEAIAHGQRHAKEIQLTRRMHLAKARNNLLLSALRDETWVLWIDVDLDYYPPDIIQHLLSAQKPVVVPNCLSLTFTRLFYQIYDRNTFRETMESLDFLMDKPDDFLMVSESKTPRKFLRDIRHEGLVVPLDGVGGCVLLVESKYHRKGLLFPTEIFEHHIETEGLGKKAVRFGLDVSGLPFVNAVHKRDNS